MRSLALGPAHSAGAVRPCSCSDLAAEQPVSILKPRRKQCILDPESVICLLQAPRIDSRAPRDLEAEGGGRVAGPGSRRAWREAPVTASIVLGASLPHPSKRGLRNRNHSRAESVYVRERVRVRACERACEVLAAAAVEGRRREGRRGAHRRRRRRRRGPAGRTRYVRESRRTCRRTTSADKNKMRYPPPHHQNPRIHLIPASRSREGRTARGWRTGSS